MNRTIEATAPTPTARFGMAHAFVITAFLTAGVVLSLTARMPAQEILVLLGGVGAVSVAVLVAAGVRNAGAGLPSRLLRAAFAPGTGTSN
ncbi:hypothetical protein QEZ40_000511 [Streptomyces katrae]|uniref:Uncharacterized protein n=1 Tax=Streptomyces katrae TaxID=68223 RepID=A0ABT7GRS1_9ACTN|nr:hypothetical protein [Streptomyces katrae]MDK9496168.1 hypothetical protein [Streptomyces katrae]